MKCLESKKKELETDSVFNGLPVKLLGYRSYMRRFRTLSCTDETSKVETVLSAD